MNQEDVVIPSLDLPRTRYVYSLIHIILATNEGIHLCRNIGQIEKDELSGDLV